MIRTMKVFSFLIILIISIILSLTSESEACVGKNWFCDWMTNRNNSRETTTTFSTSVTEDEKMQAIRNISSSINQFSIELHQAMAKKTNGSFISSLLSALMVLMMAAYGARDKNAEEMNSMLHFDTNNNTYKTGIYSLIEMFDALNPIRFKLANKIFAGRNREIKSDFMSLVRETFKSSIENVDFGRSEDTTAKINNWRAEKNYQRIRNIVESDEISADTEFFFMNSIYFSALWKTAFNESDTKPRKFKITKEKTIERPIMKRSKDYVYLTEFSLFVVPFDFKRDSNNDESMRLITLYP
ncbi:serpin B3-like [Microplitis mediator]|uniref:serpin B3-like n=1 Tax=Microplitis mediator TaxID=375433 RepID=UPI002553CC47|nr:serpin B3-like [Microplitis mediator]